MFPLLKSCNFGSSDCKILQSNLHCDKTIFTPLQLNGQLKCKIIFRCVYNNKKQTLKIRAKYCSQYPVSPGSWKQDLTSHSVTKAD